MLVGVGATPGFEIVIGVRNMQGKVGGVGAARDFPR